MKLWKISQTVNDGYDTYDSAIVAAETEEQARKVVPNFYQSEPKDSDWDRAYYTWAKIPDQVTAILIGEAAEGTAPGVILASFNAG